MARSHPHREEGPEILALGTTPPPYDIASRDRSRDGFMEGRPARQRKEKRSRRRSQAQKAADQAGVWTSALLTSLVAVLGCFAVAAAAELSRGYDASEVSVSVPVMVFTILGGLGVIAALRVLWALTLAPRLQKARRARLGFSGVCTILAIPALLHPFISDGVAGNSLLRASSIMPILLMALIGFSISGAADGKYGTHTGKIGGWLWLLVALLFVVWPSGTIVIFPAAVLAAICTGHAGIAAWKHYDFAQVGVGNSPSTKRPKSKVPQQTR